MNLSPLQKARYEYTPKLPGMLRNGISEICVKEGAETASVADQDKIKALFPNTYGKKEITFEKGQNTAAAKKQVVGVILSGGQAPGGHNVITGLYDALKATNKDNELLGFKGGPDGLLNNDYVTFDDAFIDAYRNTGGFDIIGSGRTKLETKEQFAIVADNAKKNGYIELKKDVYYVLNKGKFLIEQLEDMNISMDKYKTSELGQALKQVYRGEITIDDGVKMAEEKIQAVFDANADDSSAFYGEVVGKCPVCGEDVIRGRFAYECKNLRGGKCDFKVNLRIAGCKISEAQIKKLLFDCTTDKLKFVSKTGKNFESRLKLDKTSGKVTFDFSNDKNKA